MALVVFLFDTNKIGKYYSKTALGDQGSENWSGSVRRGQM